MIAVNLAAKARAEYSVNYPGMLAKCENWDASEKDYDKFFEMDDRVHAILDQVVNNVDDYE
jgi:hypothetical protein